mmetsp:Transcript_129492/g.360736  ORF Transcript_129492/g.360736 Transcript_129492/m.360736 type:complete len:140 (-) Transcript_129492:191-610(-)
MRTGVNHSLSMDITAVLHFPADVTSEPIADDTGNIPAADEEDEYLEDFGPNGTTAMMLHCLFAMVFAAATLGALNCLGLVVSSAACFTWEDDGYGACAMWQDFRSVMSFLMGAFVCCVVSRGNKHRDRSGKVQLYTCLL